MKKILNQDRERLAVLGERFICQRSGRADRGQFEQQRCCEPNCMPMRYADMDMTTGTEAAQFVADKIFEEFVKSGTPLSVTSSRLLQHVIDSRFG